MDDFIAANHQYRKTAAISHTPADGSAQLPSHHVRYDNGPIDSRLVVSSFLWIEKGKAMYLGLAGAIKPAWTYATSCS